MGHKKELGSQKNWGATAWPPFRQVTPSVASRSAQRVYTCWTSCSYWQTRSKSRKALADINLTQDFLANRTKAEQNLR